MKYRQAAWCRILYIHLMAVALGATEHDKANCHSSSAQLNVVRVMLLYFVGAYFTRQLQA